MVESSPSQPTNAAAAPSVVDALVLLALQIAVAAAGALVLHFLPLDTGSGSWVSGVGVMVGAQTFGMQKERKQPGVLSSSYIRRLAAYAALGQLVVGALFFVVFTPDLLMALSADPTTRVLIGIGIAAFALALVYGLSLFGLKQGRKIAQRSAPPK